MSIINKIKNHTGLDKTSFSYLNKLINSDENEIILENDFFLKKSEEKKFSSGIPIDVDDIIIDGNGHILDAQQKTRFFEITGKNITIKNVILQNGFATIGGAI